MFPHFWPEGTSPDCQDFSNTMDSGLTTSPVSSLRIRGGISSGPRDLCIFRFLRWSQIRSTVHSSSFSQSLLLPFCALGAVAEAQVIGYLSLLHIPANKSPVSFQRGITFSLAFLLSPTYLQNLFFLPLTSLARLNSISTSSMKQISISSKQKDERSR